MHLLPFWGQLPVLYVIWAQSQTLLQYFTTVSLRCIKLERPTVDYYHLLSVSRSASAAEIKAAYHRALLVLHPDKQAFSKTAKSNTFVDIASIKDAYITLSSPNLRARYDSELQESAPKGPRPAQIVSLEEFDEEATGSSVLRYGCRCGGFYKITEEDMEKGYHLVGCGSCSEVVWVGYELANNGDGMD